VNDRRITPKTEDDRPGDRLKHIAGLIQKLTYAEMRNLADQCHQVFDIERAGTEDELLEISRRLLSQ
jgi:hypothetical protein